MLWGSKTLMQPPIQMIYHEDHGRNEGDYNEGAYPWHGKVVI